MNSAYYINERATEHCAQMTLSNLVQLTGAPDVDGLYHKTTTSSKPPSRNQLHIYPNRVRKTCLAEAGSHLASVSWKDDKAARRYKVPALQTSKVSGTRRDIPWLYRQGSRFARIQHKVSGI